ncbi:uncharacterized protein [Nothobranchius furzeri]|uniref:LOC107394437-like protein n=3 Tax=Nothobranchius TaxID=28779 RepID=A0A1A7ZVU1_NOTFU|nr:uncharacterized protein LOC107394437 [Nothobranchius furzeri]KAF7210766.1 putative LOC107394437-like protein [Nothobranchius furzeri]
MPDTKLLLEALSALSGCNVESTTGSSQITPHDFITAVALRKYYKQQGFQELEYPSIGTLSVHDDEDLYSSPPPLTEGPGESLKPKVQINLQDFFHPQFDYDFTNIKDGDKTFLRGNENYIRPCGWNRAALYVLDKYSGGNQWLGTGNDAWPVSYHAKNIDGSLGVIVAHKGKPDDTPGFLEAGAASVIQEHTAGNGVYSTPDIKMAEKYCKTFKSKVDGKTYKVVLQNRINPQKRAVCQREDLWVVYIPDGKNDLQRRAIVQESIRPYGLLMKPA